MGVLHLLRSFSARISSDTTTCCLTTILEYDTNIIAVDYSNKNLKTFNAEGVCLSVLNLQSSPRRACVTPEGEIVVTIQGEYMIMFLVKFGHQLFPSLDIPTAKDYALIEAVGNSLICGKCGCPGYIDVINYRGHVLHSFSAFSSNGLRISFPSYLAVHPLGDLLLSEVRSDGYQALIRCNLNGDIKFFYQGAKKSLKCPSGVSVDQNGYIYVACRMQNQIYCLTSAGGLHNVLKTKPNAISNPGSIFVTPDGSTLILAEFGSENVKVFDIQSVDDYITDVDSC